MQMTLHKSIRNMKLLKELYKTYSPSGKEKGMRKFIVNWIKENCPNTVAAKDKMGNLYITKGKAESYPCLVAHMDQVQKIHSMDFEAIETKEIIFGYSQSHKRMEGLGADDKNGIWICLKCLEKYDAIKCVFFVKEEVGCVGSQKAVMSFFDDCRYVIQIDRKGGGDLITDIGGWTPLCSEEFVKAIRPELFGYKEETGLLTDVEALKERGLKISAVNLSCGYYSPHTDQEFTIKSELMNCLAFVQHIIETCPDVYPHENDYRDFDEYERQMELEDCKEIIAMQLERYPNATAKDFILWLSENYMYLKDADVEKLYQEEKRKNFMY